MVWHNRYGTDAEETCDHLAAASDGSFFLGGHRLSPALVRYPWIVKIDGAGKQVGEFRPDMGGYIVTIV